MHVYFGGNAADNAVKSVASAAEDSPEGGGETE